MRKFMKKYIVVEYEESDFDEVKNEMTNQEAVEILDSLPRGWFPYRHPSYDKHVSSSDYDNYRIYCALNLAIKALEGKNHG